MAPQPSPATDNGRSLHVVTVTNLKGGSGKSTTAGLLIHGWVALGYRVAGIDSDPQGTLSRWAEDGDWTVPVFGMATASLHHPSRGVAGIVGPERFDIAVIDTPPLEQERGIVHSALRVATDVVITLAPTSPEWEAVPRVWQALEDVESLRPHPAPTSVLFNRVRIGTTAAQVYRAALTEAGHHCLRTFLPMRERYAQLVGAPIVLQAIDTPVIGAAEEIAKRGEWT